MRRLLALLLLAVAAAAIAGSGIDVRPLDAAGVQALLKPPARGERIVMLWSLDCVYCEPNMRALARLQRAHPGKIELVTVATDDVARERDAVASRLAAAGMRGYAAYAYAAAAPAQLNFLMDPQWGGELPRTLVVGANGSRAAISGELTATQLRHLHP